MLQEDVLLHGVSVQVLTHIWQNACKLARTSRIKRSLCCCLSLTVIGMAGIQHKYHASAFSMREELVSPSSQLTYSLFCFELIKCAVIDRKDYCASNTFFLRIELKWLEFGYHFREQVENACILSTCVRGKLFDA